MQQIFNFKNSPVRILSAENEEIWFAGVDICNILGYAKSSTTIEKLDDDERKLEYLTDTSGQRRKTWSINESGLYSLILTSSKPEAKVFKRWITHDVLPAIRKAGKFSTQQMFDYELSLQKMVGSVESLKAQKDELQKKINDVKKEIERLTDEMIRMIKMDKSQLCLEFPTSNQ